MLDSGAYASVSRNAAVFSAARTLSKSLLESGAFSATGTLSKSLLDSGAYASVFRNAAAFSAAGARSSGDWLEFRLLVDGNRGGPAVGGRIAGTALVAAGTRGAVSLKTRLRSATQPGLAVWVITLSAVLAGGVSAYVGALRPEVPAITGQPIDVATQRLAEAGLRTGDVILVEANAPANTVIAVSPLPGQRAPEDRRGRHHRQVDLSGEKRERHRPPSLGGPVAFTRQVGWQVIRRPAAREHPVENVRRVGSESAFGPPD